ncbi:MAG: hypothetical protein HZA68_03040 [Rhodovulum sp.]|nr:hypothetical protein [Rhodovulum sp.]
MTIQWISRIAMRGSGRGAEPAATGEALLAERDSLASRLRQRAAVRVIRGVGHHRANNIQKRVIYNFMQFLGVLDDTAQPLSLTF